LTFVLAYELSLFIAILFQSSKYTTALASQLPEVYNEVDKQVDPSRSVHSTAARQASSTIALLSTLVASYPSQTTHHKLLRSFSQHVLSPKSPNILWLKSITSALRSSNFYQLDRLTRPSNQSTFLDDTVIASVRGCPRSQLASLAEALLLSQLREKTRLRTWAVLRVAYPQFACPEKSETRPWLVRSLRLSTGEGDAEATLDMWLSSRAEVGEVKLVDRIKGRWMVVKKS
jgi:hypothetical protein